MSRRRPGRAHPHLPLPSRRAPILALGTLLGVLLTTVPATAAPVQTGPATGIPTAIVAGPGGKKAPRCDGAAGWSAYSGRPTALTPLGAAGLYVWNERGTWRIAATHGDKRPQLFQGTVTFDAPVTRASGIEGKSTIAPAGPGVVAFTFKNYGQVDGIAVTAACATAVTVAGQVDGQPLAPTALFLGPSGANPAAVPAVLVRGGATEAAATTAAATTAPPTTAVCAAAAAWPTATAGRPPVNRLRNAGSPAAVFAWSDRNTWRILVDADPGDPVVLEGRITASAPLTARVLETGGRDGGRDGGREGVGRDVVRVEGNTVTFRLRGTVQGTVLEVGTGCAASLAIESLTVDGSPVTTGELVVGAGATAPTSLPYTVTR